MATYSLRLCVMLGTLATASTVCSVAAVGCGGDDTGGGLPDATSDVTTDQALDHFVTDTGGPDSAIDAPVDGGRDTGADVHQADAAPDAPLLVDFPHAIDVAYCERFASCCLQTPQTFDIARCIAIYDNAGGILGLGKYKAALDGGNINYDQQKAAACIDDFRSLPCGLLQSAQFKAILSTCYSAATGTQIANGACQASLECVSGEFCNVVGDAGMGTCTALLGADAGCSRPNGDECSYLGNGTPPLNCDPTSNTCGPRRDLDAGCNNDKQCLSGFCASKCVDSFVVSDPGVTNGFCDYFTIKDAGGGG